MAEVLCVGVVVLVGTVFVDGIGVAMLYGLLCQVCPLLLMGTPTKVNQKRAGFELLSMSKVC